MIFGLVGFFVGFLGGVATILSYEWYQLRKEYHRLFPKRISKSEREGPCVVHLRRVTYPPNARASLPLSTLPQKSLERSPRNENGICS